MRPSIEALQNLVVRAPTKGTVVNLTRLGVGAVLGAKETVAELVPAERGLILEGSLPTEQVAFLSAGMQARVRIHQLSKIGYDELLGNIETISADTISQGMLGTATYIVQVNLGQLPPDIEAVLRPVMPVEIYIQTGTRTPFQYITEPLTSFLNRAARE
jgi:multidrug efflux pump subunit AcrA (membrane-fusion protein)